MPNSDVSAQPIHFYDFDECQTVCGISDLEAPEMVDAFGGGNPADVTCARCRELLGMDTYQPDEAEAADIAAEVATGQTAYATAQRDAMRAV